MSEGTLWAEALRRANGDLTAAIGLYTKRRDGVLPREPTLPPGRPEPDDVAKVAA